MLRISIITATLNAAKTLAACLESVANQRELPEHLIIDGCSTDETLPLLSAYAGHRILVTSEPDYGLYDAMNKGVGLASGDIIGILNADDFYVGSHVLQMVLEAFSDESVEACYGDLCYVAHQNVDTTLRYWQAGKFHYRKFYWGWMPPHPTFFVRKSVYGKYGLFNLELGSAADYELMLRFLVRHRIRAKYIPQVMVKMRTGGVSNASLAARLKANRMDRKAWTVNGLRPYPWTLVMKPLRKIWQWYAKAPVE